MIPRDSPQRYEAPARLVAEQAVLADVIARYRISAACAKVEESGQMLFWHFGDTANARPNVGLWPIATNSSSGPDVSFWGEAEVGRAAEFAASVEK